MSGAAFPTQSIAFRLAVRLCLATTLFICGTFGVTYYVLDQQSQAALEATIDTDLAGLIDIYASEGPQGLVNRISDRLDMTATAQARPYYLFRDASGRRLAGNLDNWPTRVGRGDLVDTSEISNPTLPSGERLRGRASHLRGGYTLVVGRSQNLREHALKTTAQLFVASIALIVIATFLIALGMANKLSQRVTWLNKAFTENENPKGSPDTSCITKTQTRQVLGDELSQLSAHVETTLVRVRRLLHAQRDVSDHIAHETRTPLMRVEARILEAVARTDDPDVATPLVAAQAEIKALLRLLDALLDIASAEAQTGITNGLGLINVSEVAKSIVDLYRASADDAGLILEAQIEDDVFMQADAMQMSRLLINLLDNAFKYGAAGKIIRVVVRHGPYLCVEDCGSGIGMALRAEVFERYHRAKTGNVKGHGLGLALVKAIATRHDLQVGIEDTRPDHPSQKGVRVFVEPKGD